MAARVRILIISLVVALVAVGCASDEVDLITQGTNVIAESDYTTRLAYFDKMQEGQVYDVAFTVPGDWVEMVEVTNRRNQLSFRYLGADVASREFFRVEALSEAQYWAQIGSYPGQFETILNTGDTYFVYFVPREAIYTGLPEALFADIAALVPEVADTFTITPVGTQYFGAR